MQQFDYIDVVRKLALAFPSVEEGTSYGTPAFRIKGKLLARAHEDGETLVLKMDLETRDFMIQFDPDVFYITDHYRNYPYVLVRLSAIDPNELRGHLLRAWKSCAPKRLVNVYNHNSELET